MSYFGNARTLVILGNNTRDDIIPDGVTSAFELSQDVPGAYEGNVLVLRKRYITQTIVSASARIQFTSTEIKSSDPATANALAELLPPITNIRDGDVIIASGSSHAQNVGTFYVAPAGVAFNGSTATITCTAPGFTAESEGTNSITLIRGYTTEWEVLEPEFDYTISTLDYKTITFTQIPQESDKIYVMHKGDSTYNLVPSDNSVGPNQLSQNLRNFTVDKFTGNGSTTTYTLSQDAVSGKSILVSVNGVVKDPKDNDISGNTGDYYLASTTSLVFATAPANTSTIRILHLGFSTISRRAALSPSQLGAVADGSITAPKLATSSVIEAKISVGAVTTTKIADDNVTTAKILADNVTGAKILLDNNTAIRGKNTSATAKDLIKNNASNNTEVLSDNTVQLTAGSKTLALTNAGIVTPGTAVSLGDSSHKFVDGKFSGDVASATVTATGNVSCGGTLSAAIITSMLADIAALQAAAEPAGTIKDYAGASVPSGNYLFCNGAEITRSAPYANLFTAIGTTYGAGNGTTTFNIPDLRGRFVLCKSASGTGATLAATGGALDHTHTSTAHTHTLTHTHGLPAHYHGLGTGSTFNIIQSGGHTTILNHTHAGFTTASGGAHTHTVTDPGHNHTINMRGTASAPANMSGTKVSANSTTGVAIDSTNATAIIDNTTGISIPSSGAHTHTITIPAFTGTTSGTGSDGEHIHNVASMAGLIGLVTGGVDGNASMTTASQSTATTSSDGAAATTANNPAYIVLNKIIKY